MQETFIFSFQRLRSTEIETIQIPTNFTVAETTLAIQNQLNIDKDSKLQLLVCFKAPSNNDLMIDHLYDGRPATLMILDSTKTVRQKNLKEIAETLNKLSALEPTPDELQDLFKNLTPEAQKICIEFSKTMNIKFEAQVSITEPAKINEQQEDIKITIKFLSGNKESKHLTISANATIADIKRTIQNNADLNIDKGSKLTLLYNGNPCSDSTLLKDLSGIYTNPVFSLAIPPKKSVPVRLGENPHTIYNQSPHELHSFKIRNSPNAVTAKDFVISKKGTPATFGDLKKEAIAACGLMDNFPLEKIKVLHCGKTNWPDYAECNPQENLTGLSIIFPKEIEEKYIKKSARSDEQTPGTPYKEPKAPLPPPAPKALPKAQEITHSQQNSDVELQEFGADINAQATNPDNKPCRIM